MAQPIPDNSVIAHYRVLSKIGAGGMGEVYKAQDETLERPVALKVLPPELLESTDRVRRFVGEAKAASALNHPNIVTIHEIGQSGVAIPGEEPAPGQAERKIHYIAMEFIAGATLKSHIHGGETELRKLVEIMSQAAQGLAKAHNAGIVHRDLKPDNIMVTEDGYAKIVDFGLAKLTEKRKEEDEGEDHTQEGMVMGTVAYMSPEQVQGKIVDQRSDIFSFGCILFECVTRKRPFQSDTAIDMMHRIVFGQAPPIGELNPDAPEELDRIIRKCLAKDPDERFQSIKEVAVDLKNLARDWAMQPAIGGFRVESPYRSDPRMPVVTSGQQPTYTRSAAAPPGSATPAAAATLKRPPRHKPIGRWVFRGVLLLLVVLVAWLWYSHPDISGLGERAPATLPLVEDRRAGSETGVEWEWVDYERIAAPLHRAVVAAVDDGFMERTPPGIEELRQEGAVGDLIREKKIPGLSPISRQAARAAVLGSSGPLDPIRQFVVAFDLEKSLPKERILELYLNSIEFTPRLYGVEAASQHYFNLSAASLDEQQAALLAASIGTPEINLGDPPGWLKARQEMILEKMKDER